MLWWLLACGSDALDSGGAAARACNGHASLCDRSLSDVSLLAAHNAMSSAADGWLAPNQTWDVPTQLAAGVRGLMLDTWEWEGGAWLCHGYCELGAQPLAEGAAELVAFLDAHPDEVLVLVVEAHLSADATEEAFAAAGLLPLLAPHEPGEPWPTLAALLDAGTPVVALASEGGGAFPGYLDEWAQAWENPYAYERGDPFSCAVDRGDPDAPLAILNHFYTDPLASAELAAEANTWDSLWEHAERCRAERGAQPTLLTLDFVDLGEGGAVVDALNGVD